MESKPANNKYSNLFLFIAIVTTILLNKVICSDNFINFEDNNDKESYNSCIKSKYTKIVRYIKMILTIKKL